MSHDSRPAPGDPHTGFDPGATVTLPVVWRREDIASTGVRLGCLSVVLAVLTWFIVVLVLTVPLHLPKPTAWALGAVAAIVLVVVIALTSRRQRAAHRARNCFVLDPSGITQREAHGSRTLPWDGIRAVGNVAPMRKIPGKKGHLVDPSSQVDPLSPIGLVGIGAMSADVDASPHVETQYRANASSWGQDAATGQNLVGINPSRVIESGRWDQSAIGDYLRHYRPDVWPAVQQQFERNA